MKTLHLLAFVFFSFTIPTLSAHAETEQKMIIVKGEKSYLMDGDTYKNSFNKPKGYSKDSVLPAFLSIGWYIKSIHVNEKSTEENLYGYVLIQHEK